MDIRRLIEPKVNTQITELLPGDTVRVSLKTVEGDKERIQHFQGLVLRVRRGVDGGSFTVRRVFYGIGVERTFSFQSPLVQSVEIVRRGKVRRSKLYYMRHLSTKQTRLKERSLKMSNQAVQTEEETETETESETE
jgi:large subunit ribosomal protein L19